MKNSIEFLKYSLFNRSTVFLILFFSLNFLSAQVKLIDASDSTFIENLGSIEEFQSVSNLDPNKAAVLSAILPGLGQAYNGQFWKIPIVYGGAIIIGHYINYNHQFYHEFRNAVDAARDNSDQTINFYGESFSTETAVRNRDQFRRDRDFLIIVGGVFYLLNIVDSHVSAHLKEFDINDNLSMNIKPTIQSSPVFSQSFGFTLALNIK
ncbi:MAG: DUF5683 domain-containing protein [Cyclobacteriaceae bacterium]